MLLEQAFELHMQVAGNEHTDTADVAEWIEDWREKQQAHKYGYVGNENDDDELEGKEHHHQHEANDGGQTVDEDDESEENGNNAPQDQQIGRAHV